MQALNTQQPPPRVDAAAPARVGSRMEHRFGRRYSCGESVRICAGDRVTGIGRLVNVSMSGAYVQSTMNLPPFLRVSLIKPRADDGTHVELLASVVRGDAGGFAVEWCETPACSICQLLGCPQPCHP
jgi:hypothetical protein